MAIIDSRGAFHGSAGNLVFRTWKGRRIAQAKPRPYQQTQATKESGIDFGVASSAAKSIRRAFASLFRGSDSGMINRLNRSVLAAIRASPVAVRGQRDLHDGEVSLLSGMEFNAHSPLAEVLGFRPQVSRNAQGQVVVNLPDFHSGKDVRVPPAYRFKELYTLRFQLIAFNYKEQFYEYLGTQDVDLPSYKPVAARQLAFEEAVPEGCLLLLGMAFLTRRYSAASGQYECMNDREFSPAALIAGFAAEELVREETPVVAKQAVKRRRSRMSYVGNGLIDRYGKWLVTRGICQSPPERSMLRQEERIPDIPLNGKRVNMKD